MINYLTYLNSEFTGYVPYTEKLRGICFRPAHYFCGGKTYVLKEPHLAEKAWETFESYPSIQHHWKNTIKMAVLIVPALAVGTVAAIIAVVRMRFWFSYDYNNLWYRWGVQIEPPVFKERDRALQFNPPTHRLTDEFSPIDLYTTVSQRWFELAKKINSPKVWNRTEIREEFSHLIEQAYGLMDLMFQHVAEAAKGNPEKMATILYPFTSTSNTPINKEIYHRIFMYNSIGSMYFAMRVSLCFRKDDGKLRYIYPKPTWNRCIESSQSKPFFTPNTPEYRWRCLYNSACALIDTYGLREALDKRCNEFTAFAVPDYSPSTWPSNWGFRVHFLDAGPNILNPDAKKCE